MSKEKAHNETAQPVEPAAEHRNAPRKNPVSGVLVAAFAVVLIGGAAFGLSRKARQESEFFNALSNSGATLLTFKGAPEKNGLEDMYAVVEFQQHRESITRFFGYCETSPEVARNVFRRAMDEGNRNSRMVALSAAFYLANTHSVTEADWERLVSRLNPERESEVDVRRVAQRSIADLLLIKERSAKGALLATPEGFKETDSEAPTARTELRDFNVEGAKYYQARWTSPALAFAWLQQHGKNGKWNEKMQRFVIE